MNQRKSSTIFGMERDHFAFYMAQDFFEKGLAATKEVHPPNEFRFNEKNHWAICFPICTLAFSLELALKGFLSESDTKLLVSKKKGHTLISLYDAINIDTQTSIENHFEVCTAHNHYFFNVRFLSIFEDVTPSPLIINTKEKIIDALKRNDKPFMDFRYFYEKAGDKDYSFDFTTIVKLIHSCLAVKANELGIKLNS